MHGFNAKGGIKAHRLIPFLDLGSLAQNRAKGPPLLVPLLPPSSIASDPTDINDVTKEGTMDAGLGFSRSGSGATTAIFLENKGCEKILSRIVKFIQRDQYGFQG